jgi:predicted metal-binding membrane protein
MSGAVLDRVLRDRTTRDRLLVALALLVVAAIAWSYLLRSAAAMDAMTAEMRRHAAMGMVMPDTHTWGLADWFGLFVMWAVMMVAMMLPSALPVIMLVLGVYTRRGDRSARVAAVAFILGYVLAWTSFSLLASIAQLTLHRFTLIGSDMRLASDLVGGVLLIAAGAYQFLPLKTACLTHCRSPLGFISAHWREGAGGGLRLGWRHGLFCVGCCWLVMTLLFVVGVMNLFWIAVLAAFVLIEKTMRGGEWVGRAAGIATAALGLYLLI